MHYTIIIQKAYKNQNIFKYKFYLLYLLTFVKLIKKVVTFDLTLNR